jgi:phosphonate transport system permease protein
MSDQSFHAMVAAIQRNGRHQRLAHTAWMAVALSIIGAALLYAGAFDLRRYGDSLPTLWTLLKDSLPPDFSRWPNWGRPLLDTLTMSIVGTVLAALCALPLGVLASQTMMPSPMAGRLVRLLLNMVRSIPGLIWGVIFVAAVGFGPLPGILALACHSTGMLGKFFAETLDHVDRGPGDALHSHGVSYLGVLRFSILPQILPRLLDITLYRWEHNVRAAITIGMVGAGGLGLEIITAFHLFEYREAMALILILLGLVSIINGVGGFFRQRLLKGL